MVKVKQVDNYVRMYFVAKLSATYNIYIYVTLTSYKCMKEKSMSGLYA